MISSREASGGSNSKAGLPLRNIIVKTMEDGSVTTLKDVARIELGAGQYSLRSLLNNQPAVAIPISQAPGANALELSDAVRATMKELSLNFPEGVSYQIVYDPTVFVRDSIHAVVETLLEALAWVGCAERHFGNRLKNIWAGIRTFSG